MTFLAVLMLGVGILYIASALDNRPLGETMAKILAGGIVDWTGGIAQPTPKTSTK